MLLQVGYSRACAWKWERSGVKSRFQILAVWSVCMELARARARLAKATGIEDQDTRTGHCALKWPPCHRLQAHLNRILGFPSSVPSCQLQSHSHEGQEPHAQDLCGHDDSTSKVVSAATPPIEFSSRRPFRRPPLRPGHARPRSVHVLNEARRPSPVALPHVLSAAPSWAVCLTVAFRSV